MRQSEDMLVAHVKELRRLLAICVRRLGGHVVVTPDDDDREPGEVRIRCGDDKTTDLQVS